jgi:hypothetical protein
MMGSLEVKITISEAVTPTLFKALTAVSNPRQRAALLKRLAEDALRGSVAPSHASPSAGCVNNDGGNTDRDTPASSAADSIAVSDHPSARADHAPLKPATSNEEERQFDYAFLADKLGDF